MKFGMKSFIFLVIIKEYQIAASTPESKSKASELELHTPRRSGDRDLASVAA
jgi:hypothetical protein